MNNSGSSQFFTRHLFRSGLECPVKLYYNALNYPENRESEPFIAHVRNNRKLLKYLARSFYPDGLLIRETSVQKAFKKTRMELEKGRVTLFEPEFLWNRCRARVSILDKKDDRVFLYAIQTKAFDKRKHRLHARNGTLHSKWSNYVHDFAYQAYIVKKLYPGWELNPYLVLPDKRAKSRLENLPKKIIAMQEGVRDPVDGINKEELLFKIDVRKEIEEIWDGRSDSPGIKRHKSFAETLDWMTELYFSRNKPEVEVGGKCKNCEFRLEEDFTSDTRSGFRECWEEAVSYRGEGPHVFELIGPGTRMMVRNGIYTQEEVLEDDLVPLNVICREDSRITELHRQTLQVLKAKEREIPAEIIKEPLKEEVGRWEGPVHFLDFEAGNYVIPIRANRKPYRLLVFQFSCHTLYNDGSLVHNQWIHPPGAGSYANYELVRHLKEVPDLLKGTLVTYSNFERNALKGIMKEIREEQDEIEDGNLITEWLQQVLKTGSTPNNSLHVADMNRLVKNYYYNRDMDNSLSIKDVLKSVMTVSDTLKELYTQPYSSSNFEQILWWQWDETREAARNPFDILQENQGRVEVKRGTEAMVQYGRMLGRSPSPEMFERLKKTLFKYCELDTLAMVMIYQHWKARLGLRI